MNEALVALEHEFSALYVFRWFVGIGVDAGVWDHSVFSPLTMTVFGHERHCSDERWSSVHHPNADMKAAR